MVFENAILFLRDALITREFTDAVRAGDSGRVILVLKIWALSFRGNGRTKYAYEMLHLIHNLENVWPQPVRDAVLNNWLISTNGRSFLEVDLMQEHLNYWIKVFYKAHGSNMSWRWLAMITPCVNALRELARTMNDALGYDQGSKHTSVDPVNDIHCIMESLDDHGTYDLTLGRVLEDDQEVADATSVGLHNTITGTSCPLNEFNSACSRLQQRHRMIPVDIDDDIPLPEKSLPTTLPPNSPSSSTSKSPSLMPSTSHIPESFKNSEVLGNEDEDESPDGEDDLCRELETLLKELETGGGEPTLQLTTPEDVNLDFDDEALYNQTDDFLDESHVDLEEEEPLEAGGESDIFEQGR
ncbi:hypothetical protein BT96DRAFT_825506 [Gymnopus androsaceus JB14]|uniref:DUF6589 domain-containing protein n=1 Tax=Gymnopus androsaceus JB14 TaxID=1447944 RepID=A0A6A4HG46_9AGAR|nr:hypothetical protein BT96DRAFT_825506 [Gymnopus androsaceus JB14]